MNSVHFNVIQFFTTIDSSYLGILLEPRENYRYLPRHPILSAVYISAVDKSFLQ
jgi:hypothetical protein